MTGFTDLGYAKVSYAMQLPDVIGAPSGDGNASGLPRQLPARQPRRPAAQTDGSILQALNLMNNNFVVQRTHAAGTNASQLIVQNLNRSNTDLDQHAVPDHSFALSHGDEMTTAQAAIPSGGNTRGRRPYRTWSGRSTTRSISFSITSGGAP